MTLNNAEKTTEWRSQIKPVYNAVRKHSKCRPSVKGGGISCPWQYQGIDPGELGSWPPPLKICRKGHSMFWPPENVTVFRSKLLLSESFTTSRMNSWILSLHWSCLCWQCYHPYVCSAPSRQCPPINAFAAKLGLSYRGPRQNSKTWVQVTRRRQSS